MTLDQARQLAQEIAEQTGVTIYVVYDPAYRDAEPDKAYYPAGAQDVDTFFAGVDIVFAADPTDVSEQRNSL